jgi:hypothetical protein
MISRYESLKWRLTPEPAIGLRFARIRWLQPATGFRPIATEFCVAENFSMYQVQTGRRGRQVVTSAYLARIVQ